MTELKPPASEGPPPGVVPQAPARDRLLTIEIPLWILAILAAGYLLSESATFALWIVCSFFLFAILDPFMQRLGRKGLSPVISAVVLIAIASGIATGIIALIFHFSGSISAGFEGYRKTLIHLYHSVSAYLEREIHHFSQTAATATSTPADVQQVEVVETGPLGNGMGAKVAESVGALFTSLTFATLCPILTFFMIAERGTLSTAFSRALGDDGKRGAIVWTKITDAIRAFFFGNLVLGAVCFPVFCILFRAFHVQSPYGLAAAASLLNLIPFLGSLLSGLLPALDLLSQSMGNAGHAAALVGACLVIHFMVANLVTPKILGSKVDLNATTSTIALVLWGEIWGGMGLLLAIPITATLKILFQHSRSSQLHWIALLMSDDPESLINTTSRQVFPNREHMNRFERLLGIKPNEPSDAAGTPPKGKSTPPPRDSGSNRTL